MTIKQILRDFSAWTSAHGIPHIGSAQNSCLRIFWTLVFLASTGAFVSQMVLLIQKYLKYEVTVQTELKFEERSFPAVTVCNLNPYKKWSLGDSSIKTLMDEYAAALQNSKNNQSLKTPTYGLTGDAVAVQARANDILLYLSAGLDNETKTRLVYGKEEFIKNCAYNTKPCDIPNDFEQYIDPVYGACYIFNYKTPPRYNSTRAGPLYGLRLLVQSNQSEYLDLTESAGVRVTIDSQTETPFPDAFGYNAAAGFTTSFGIKFIKTVRKGPPYGNCTDNPSTDYFYNGPYSTEACFRSCFQRQIIKNCTCADPRYNLPNDKGSYKYCNWNSMDCVNSYTSTGNTAGSQSSSSAAAGQQAFDPVQQCACPQPCTESTYGVTVSTALWPSEVYTPPDCKDDSPIWGNNKTACQKWYSENTMLIEVYYERMNYQELTESEAYALVNLISDMGGQLGLWMGFSVITVIEFFALFILVCLYACHKPKPQPPQAPVQQDRVHPIIDPNQKAHPFDGRTPPPPPAYTESDLNGPRNRAISGRPR
jgi:hypothetical protein